MKDLFSKNAAGYATFRPTYPEVLYDFIMMQVKARKAAWDCGTGNGQVARDLAKYFEKVCATDSSTRQLENAATADNIQYSLAPADKTSFPEATFDLITAGQAIHWFNIPGFYKEAARVAKPNAVIAVWGYSLLSILPTIDVLISDFYRNLIGPYWDAERKLVDEHYRTIPFPFEEIPSPVFSFSIDWTLAELQGYLTTWSAVQKYILAHDVNPVEKLAEQIRPHWKGNRMTANFPLFVRCGRIRK
jgi:ubiquinone/menaquinone biosynthesis C-methylase UbiE